MSDGLARLRHSLFLQPNSSSTVCAVEPPEKDGVQRGREDITDDWHVVGLFVLQAFFGSKLTLSTNATARTHTPEQITKGGDE